MVAQKKKSLRNKKNSKRTKSFLIFGGTILALLGGILVGGYFIAKSYISASQQPSMPNFSKLSQSQQEAVMAAIGHTFSNIHGYTIVCAQSGYDLKNYPKEFKVSMGNEIDGLEQILMRDEVSLEEAFKFFITHDIQEQISERLYNELKIIAAPDDEGVASACLLLDQDAADIAQNVADEMRPFYFETLSPLFKN